MAGGRPRFAADAMLGSLARWLRLLGYDTTYEREVADAQLVERAKAQGRIVLTRDRAVAKSAREALFIAAHDLDTQLATVLASLGREIPQQAALERCSMCNAELVKTTAAAAKGAGVPERVVESHDAFWRCPGCARVYWMGTHVASMEQRLAALRAREPGFRRPPRNR